MILIEKLQKYQLYHEAKIINTNILYVKKYYLLIKKITEQAKFTYSLLGKIFEKQTKTNEDQECKQAEAIQKHGKKLAESNALQ